MYVRWLLSRSIGVRHKNNFFLPWIWHEISDRQATQGLCESNFHSWGCKRAVTSVDKERLYLWKQFYQVWNKGDTERQALASSIIHLWSHGSWKHGKLSQAVVTNCIYDRKCHKTRPGWRFRDGGGGWGQEDVRGEHLRNGYGVKAVYMLHQSGRGYGCVFMTGVGRLLCVDKDRIGLTQTSHRNIKATAP